MNRLRVLLSFSWAIACLICATPLLAHEQLQPIFIEGYTDQLSYRPGETVRFSLNSSAPKVAMEIARVGKETKTVWQKSDVPAETHPIPEDASSHGCRWPVTFELPIPEDWKTGYYQVRLVATDSGGPFVQRNRRTAESRMFFVVRAANPGQQSKILLQLCTNTYNAYNNWGGYSLYSYHARNKLQGHRVSFDRPLVGQFDNWERPFVQWAEKNGYELEYAVNSDLEFHPEILKNYRLVLSVGHDEYWSAPMRDNLEAFIANGGNVAFFSGNTCCWQVRSEEDGRALLCWKQWFNQDPVYKTEDRSLLTSLWSHHLVGRPENSLTGVGFLYGGYHRSHGQFMDGSGAYTVHRPDHWIFEGTGLKQGDSFGSKNTIVGYECDGCEFTIKDGLPVPTYKDGTPKTFVILGTAPARWHPDDCEWYEKWEKGRTGASVLGLYTRNGTVFTCGSTDWAHGLTGDDPIVERITKNILDRLSK